LLTEAQLRAALLYAERYLDVIEARIVEYYTCLPESLRTEPSTRWRSLRFWVGEDITSPRLLEAA